MFEGIIGKLDELQFNSTSNFSLYTDKEKEGGNMEFRRSQEMQKQLFVVTKNAKNNNQEEIGAQSSSWSLTN